VVLDICPTLSIKISDDELALYTLDIACPMDNLFIFMNTIFNIPQLVLYIFEMFKPDIFEMFKFLLYSEYWYCL